LEEAFGGGPLSGLKLTRQVDGLLQVTNVATLNGAVTLAATGYEYSGGRLAKVLQGENMADF